MGVVNMDAKLAKIAGHWQPGVVARLNDYEVKLVKVHGDFVWHSHDDTDELFVVHKGEINIQFRNRDNWVRAGELFVVPKGVEHRPCAPAECEMMLIEPRGVVNTGDAGGDRTYAPQWLE